MGGSDMQRRNLALRPEEIRSFYENLGLGTEEARDEAMHRGEVYHENHGFEQKTPVFISGTSK